MSLLIKGAYALNLWRRFSMKKLISLVLALVMALALVVFAGCGQPGGVTSR